MIRSVFKAFRWLNLLVIVISMIFIRYLIILPTLHLEKGGAMPPLSFILLIAATLFIAVGGYLINDIKDVDADNLNKPGKNPVGTLFPVQTAMKLYYLFTISGVAAGTLLSVLAGRADFSLIFLLTAGLLWFYARRYQCQPFVGNVVVAFLSALSFGLVWLYDFLAVVPNTGHLQAFKEYFAETNRMVLIYMGFAFLVSLVREVVKDMEDYEGDDRFGCRTFAVVYGTRAAKMTALIFLFAGFLFSGYIQYYFYHKGYLSLYYFFYVIDILFLLNSQRLIKAANKKEYGLLSAHLKILMVAGILSMVLYYIDITGYVG